ncbi:hypothetical protein ABC397_10140 [Brevundimonas sp. 2P06AA]|uniref:hypothetical protein n=1 Tax=unclassified Brevundimonas TaxID=2622653 RepID=UPI0039A2E725
MKTPYFKPARALSVAAIAVGLTLSACSSEPATPAATADAAPATAQDAFFANLTALCGQRFEGKVVTNEAANSDFVGKRLLMHVRDCSKDEIRIPFWVGEDRSRTWVVTRTESGLRLKHDHRQPDGKTDPLHWYGGDTKNEGTAERQEFPVDQESIDLFNAQDASVSTTNVWAMEVRPGKTFTYELRRPNRHFQVDFDLTKPVAE